MAPWRPTGAGDGSHHEEPPTAAEAPTAEAVFAALSSENAAANEAASSDSSEQDKKDLLALLEHGVPLSKLDQLYGKELVRQVGKDFVESEVGRAASVRLDLGQALLMRSETLKKDERFNQQLVEVLREDPPEELMDPLMLHVMHEPVVLSSGFIVDRSSVLVDPADPHSRLRFHKCPFSRVELQDEVFPINMMKAKCQEWKQKRINKAIAIGKGFLDAGNYEMAIEVLEAVEQLLAVVDPSTYRHTATKVADLIAEVPEAQRSPKLTLRYFDFAINAASADAEIAALKADAVACFIGKAASCLDSGDAAGAAEWLTGKAAAIVGSVQEKKPLMRKSQTLEDLPEWEKPWTVELIKLYRAQDPAATPESEIVLKSLKATTNAVVSAIAEANPDWSEALSAFLARRAESRDSIMIPLNKCFDVQWNPPGVPALRVHGLNTPYGDRRTGTRTGHYTFTETSNGHEFCAVRDPSGPPLRHYNLRPDDSYVVFDSVDWVSTNGSMMMFKGDGFYGTLIMGPDDELDEPDEDPIYRSDMREYLGCHKPSAEEAIEWLRANYGQ